VPDPGVATRRIAKITGMTLRVAMETGIGSAYSIQLTVLGFLLLISIIVY